MAAAAWRQILVTSIATMISFNVGIAFGWTSPNNPKLRDNFIEDTPLDIMPSIEEMSWIGPLMPLGAAISPYLAVPLAHYCGPKIVLLSTALLYIATYLILGLGKTISLIYVARVVHGCGVGFNMASLPIYIGEITKATDHGSHGTIVMIYFTLGVLFTFAVGPFVRYVTFHYICIAFPVIFIVLFLFMPESPFYTMKRGDMERTKKTLTFLRGTSEALVVEEMQEIRTLIDLRVTTTSWTVLFTNKTNLKALFICTGLVWTQQFSGINAIVMYAQTIFAEAGTFMTPQISAIIIAVTEVVAIFFTTIVTKRFRAKTILLVSNVGMIISLGVLGLYFYLLIENSSIVNSILFLPIVTLTVYIFIFSIGFGTVPWELAGEMFPVEVVNTAAMIISSVCWAFAFVVTKFFVTFDELIGPCWVFWLLTVFLLIGLIFTCFFVFNTKGLTVEQIQEKLNGST